MRALAERFGDLRPEFKGRISDGEPKWLFSPCFSYGVFLCNARVLVQQAERRRFPFAFTLYPGGGFLLDNEASDDTLRRIFSSPEFRKVIVTQKLTRDYILSKKLCGEENIEFIFGVVVPSPLLDSCVASRHDSASDGGPFQICFAAHKYMPGGRDKGYDVFVDFARELSRRMRELRFHVIGGWAESDGDFGAARERVQFHGPLASNDMAAVFNRMDLIVAPNAPFQLAKGAFDGFPTGCCTEAALCGVAVFATDPLGLNSAFKNHDEIVIVPRDAIEIADEVESYCRDPERLRRLATKGREAFARVYSPESQLEPRFSILDRYLSR